MNSEVATAEPGLVLGRESYNTYNHFDSQVPTLHGLDDGHHLLEDFLATNTTGDQFDTTNREDYWEPMADEAVMEEVISHSPSKALEGHVAATPPRMQENNNDLDSDPSDAHDSAQVLSDTGRSVCNNFETAKRSDTSNKGNSSERAAASQDSTLNKGTGTPSFPQGQRPRTSTTSFHGDGLPDHDHAHSMSSIASSAIPSRAVMDRRTQNRMGLEAVLHSNASSPANGRQPLQHRSSLPGSGLRYGSIAGETEGHPSSKSSTQPFDQDHNQDPFTTAQSPHGTYVHHNTMARAQTGSHFPNGHYGAEGVHASYTGRGQVFHGQGYSYYPGSPPLPSHSNPLPHLSQSMYHGSAHGDSHNSGREMSMLPQPAIQHFQPYGHDFEMHRNMGQQGYGGLKQEDSSPRSMASVPTLGSSGNDNYTPPQERTLRDLEPNPTFEDSEDVARLTKIQAAMMDMRSAEDNDGMKKTWVALSKDRVKVQQVCKKVLNACYVSQHMSAPLQHSVKPQHHYETLDERVDAICEAFKQQKTMCKHLMEAPYLYQVVDDPNLAAMRVINNRKVNKGKKEAIEQGRKALRDNRKPGAQSNDLKTEFDDDYVDDGLEDVFYDEDDEASAEPHGLPSYPAPALVHGNQISKRSRPTAARQMSSDDSTDLTYRVPPSKKAKKNNSMYQLNDRNEMVDLSVSRKGRRTSQPIARRAIQNRRFSQTYPPNLSDYNNSGTELESDNAAMGYGWSEEDFQHVS